VVAQASTVGDWNDGTNGEDKAGFYDPANGAPVIIGSDAEYLLKQAARPTVTGVTITSNPAPEYIVGTTTSLGFTASVQGRFLDGITDSDKVTWSISSGSGGTINPTTGVFTGATTNGTYTVTATSVYDTSKKATVQLNVIAPVVTGVTITSGSAPTYWAGASAPYTFTATVQGTNLLGTEKVTWSISSGSGGTINANTGVFSGGTTAGTYTVTARSVDNTTKYATTNVTVATKPVVATTRKITAAAAGDTSDWLEIATYGNYSLMIRAKDLPQTINAVAKAYVGSPQQIGVNTWYAGTGNLATNAPLRRYAMRNTALADLGMGYDEVNGFSVPVAGSRGATGNDVAFLGSFAEFSAFCSITRGTPTTGQVASSAGAQANFRALNTTAEAGYTTDADHEPGRSPAGTASTDYCIRITGPGRIGGGEGAVALMSTTVATNAPYSIRPMLWVDNSAGASLFTSR
jgi:hypothetical protein